MSAYSDLILAHASLKAYYRLDEGSGTTLTDAGPNALNGTYAASGITYGAVGSLANDVDTAVTFDATADPATVADNNALDLGDGPLSIEFWVKRSATQSADQGIVTKGATTYQVRFDVANRIALIKQGTAGAIALSPAIVDTTTWHHVVATKNGSTSKVYVDGSDATAAGTNQTFGNSATVLRIGHLAAGVSRFPGSLDELAIYGAVLSPAEVLQHYNTGRAIVELADVVVVGHAVTVELTQPPAPSGGGPWRPLPLGDEKPKKRKPKDLALELRDAVVAVDHCARLRVAGHPPTLEVSVPVDLLDADQSELRRLRENLSAAEEEAELWMLGFFD